MCVLPIVWYVLGTYTKDILEKTGWHQENIRGFDGLVISKRKMRCQRRSSISANTAPAGSVGGALSAWSYLTRMNIKIKYKISKFCNLKIKWPKSIWNVENRVSSVHSTKLLALEDGPLSLPKWHWRTRLRTPKISAIWVIVSWRPPLFGGPCHLAGGPSMVCIPNATSKVTPRALNTVVPM